jgi:nucleoside-diphosphate-sugar epimerase
VTEVAVTGANGFVGSYVVEELATFGFGVRGLVRSIARPSMSPTAAPFVQIDYEDANAILRLLDGVDMVVHLLGLAHQKAKIASEYDRVNVGYTRRVVEASAQMGITRFVFVSSVKVLGNGAAIPYSEHSIPNPEDPYGRSKLRAEDAVRAETLSSGIEHVILRPPLVYGAGVKGNLHKLIGAIERGLPIPIARSETNIRSFISVRNLASAIRRTLSVEGPIGSTYLVSDGSDISTVELVEMISRVAGKRPRTIGLPSDVLRILARVAHQRHAADRFLSSLRVDPAPFSARFDWHPPYLIEDGIREAVEGYRARVRAR